MSSIPPPPQPPPYGYQGGGAPQPMPNNYLVPAILTTLFCCLPFGIVSIVYAAQVGSKWGAGDYAGAQRSSDMAKNWAVASAVAGVILLVIYVAALSSSSS